MSKKIGPGFDNWEAALASKSHGDGFSVFDKFFMENADNWNKVSFKNLLALADAAGAATTETASICTVLNDESRSSTTNNFTSEMEYAYFRSISATSSLGPSLHDHEPKTVVAPDAPNCKFYF